MRLLLTLFCTALMGTLAAADKATDYTATVSGVVCSACKAHVTAAMKRLPGVQEVSFAKGDMEGTQTVTFNSSSAALTRQDLVKALGDDAKNYEVLELRKAE